MATVTEMPPLVTIPVVSRGEEPIQPTNSEMLYEVVDGEIREKTVGAEEVWISYYLSVELGKVVVPSRLGTMAHEALFLLDAKSRLKRRPDVAFISADRWPVGRRSNKGEAWTVIPDLAVEVISPSELAVQMMAKVREYFDHGVRRVWLVFPAERWIYDYASPTNLRIFAMGDEVDGGDLIPGFRLPLSSLFEDQGGESGVASE